MKAKLLNIAKKGSVTVTTSIPDRLANLVQPRRMLRRVLRNGARANDDGKPALAEDARPVQRCHLMASSNPSIVTGTFGSAMPMAITRSQSLRMGTKRHGSSTGLRAGYTEKNLTRPPRFGGQPIVIRLLFIALMKARLRIFT